MNLQNYKMFGNLKSFSYLSVAIGSKPRSWSSRPMLPPLHAGPAVAQLLAHPAQLAYRRESASRRARTRFIVPIQPVKRGSDPIGLKPDLIHVCTRYQPGREFILNRK
jgi:hypothetical protein